MNWQVSDDPISVASFGTSGAGFGAITVFSVYIGEEAWSLFVNARFNQ